MTWRDEDVMFDWRKWTAFWITGLCFMLVYILTLAPSEATFDPGEAPATLSESTRVFLPVVSRQKQSMECAYFGSAWRGSDSNSGTYDRP